MAHSRSSNTLRQLGWRRTAAAITIGAAALATAGCGSDPTDFDTFLERHRCEKLALGKDGDIDMSCIDPATGKRVDIEFEANDRPDQYFTDTEFGGIVWVFTHEEVKESQAYAKLKKKK